MGERVEQRKERAHTWMHPMEHGKGAKKGWDRKLWREEGSCSLTGEKKNRLCDIRNVTRNIRDKQNSIGG